MLPAGCHTHDVDPKYAFLTTARRDADGRTPDDPSFNARTLKVDWHKEPINKLTGTQQTWWQVKETHATACCSTRSASSVIIIPMLMWEWQKPV